MPGLNISVNLEAEVSNECWELLSLNYMWCIDLH